MYSVLCSSWAVCHFHKAVLIYVFQCNSVSTPFWRETLWNLKLQYLNKLLNLGKSKWEQRILSPWHIFCYCAISDGSTTLLNILNFTDNLKNPICIFVYLDLYSHLKLVKGLFFHKLTCYNIWAPTPTYFLSFLPCMCLFYQVTGNGNRSQTKTSQQQL